MKNISTNLVIRLALVLLGVWVSAVQAKPSDATGNLNLERLIEKEVPAKHFYFGEYSIIQAKDQPTSEGVAKQIAQTIAFKTSSEIDGAFSLLVEGESIEFLMTDKAKVQLGWWVKREGEAVDNFRSELKPAMRCLSAEFKGDQQALVKAWQELYQAAMERGYKISGDGRMLIKLHSNTGYLVAELQLAIE
ncbi:hypothetical protein [Litoribacillus peritrichatus]|uniref:Uncharacterized protein n=1 Tax=Litoribacillus peritrichatus TaxID=718191 RepID=A0ABP7MMD4_9GAMM